MIVVKLSLVVPTYGVENYINRFLDSLEKNLQRGIEVLIIDDGTKDCSGKIADEFAAKYPQYVTVVHKENGGVSSARNEGLELAKGEYIIFPDPDDWLAEDYVETILSAIDEYDEPDFIFFDYYIGSDEKGFKRHNVPKFKEGFVDKEKFIDEHAKDTNIKGMVWCKAIKKSFYNGLNFNTKTRVAEDYELLTDLVLNINTIVYIPKPLYYYVMRESSLTHNGTIDDALRFYELALDRYRKHSRLYKKISTFRLVKIAHSVLVKAYLHNENIEFEKYEKTIKRNIGEILLSSDFKLNEKKQCLLVYLGLAKTYYKIKYGK